jgi:uncharacterized Zn finger protein (UPF0148 family)
MSASGHAHGPGSELRRRRDELAEQVAELHWNLGGLTYEMAIRDHFRLDVLIRRAAMLQERDAELAEVERLLHMQESSVAGSCASCGAVRSRGAVFCWQCGAQVMERSTAVSSDITTETVAAKTETAELETQTAELHTTTANGGDGTSVQPVQALAATSQELGRPVQASP